MLNHTHTHPPLAELEPDAVRAEVLAAADAIRDAGVAVPFDAVRPPFLSVDDRVRAVLAELGYLEVGATVGTRDYLPGTSAEEIRDEILRQLAPGAVVVLHDGAIDSAAGAPCLRVTAARWSGAAATPARCAPARTGRCPGCRGA